MPTFTRPRPTPGVYAANTTAAMDRLTKGQPGDTITEQEMAAIISEPCGAMTSGYGVVTRAIRYTRRDANVVWQRDRAIPGWRCLDDGERIKYVRQSGAKRIGRLARKNLEILAADSSKLNAEQKRDQQILQVTHGMILAGTRASFRRQIASRIADHQKLQRPTDAKLIELMRPPENGK